MQNNVNAQKVIDLIVYSFGEDNVQTCDGGIVKLTVNGFANDIKFVTDCLVYADIQIRRSGKGVIVLFIPKEDANPRTIEISEAIEKTWHAAENDLFAGPKVTSKADDFKKSAIPLMEYLSENYHPHVWATVDSEGAMLLEGLQTVKRD